MQDDPQVTLDDAFPKSDATDIPAHVEPESVSGAAVSPVTLTAAQERALRWLQADGSWSDKTAPRAVFEALGMLSVECIAMTAITWSAREALACAYCWSGFINPEKRTDTPEQYWLSLSERVRQAYRDDVERASLLDVSHGSAMALHPAAALTDEFHRNFGDRIGVKAANRVTKILKELFYALKESRSGRVKS